MGKINLNQIYTAKEMSERIARIEITYPKLTVTTNMKYLKILIIEKLVEQLFSLIIPIMIYRN